jgi:hypothetical protein
MSVTSGTPAEGGIGIPQAQDAISNLLAADDGDTQEVGEAQQPEAQAEGTETEETEALASEETVEESDDSEETDEQTEQEQQSPTTLKVKVNGEEIDVTLDELQRGYSRQADYSRKTQQLAEERKAFQAEAEAIRQERAQYSTLLTALQQQLQSTAQIEQQPDWDRLYEEDPINATRLERQWRKVQEDRAAKLSAIKAEQDRLNQALEQQTAEQMKALLIQQAQRLPEIIPEWKDEKVAAEGKKQLRSWLVDQGLNEVEINSLHKAEHVSILRKAMLYDLGQRKAQAAVKPQPMATRPVRPGSAAVAPGNKSVTDATRAKQRLAKTGTVTDAAAVFAAIL